MVGKGWPPPRHVRRRRAHRDGRRRRDRAAVAGRSGLRHARAADGDAGLTRRRCMSIDDHVREGAGAAGARRGLDDHAAGVARSRMVAFLPERSAFRGRAPRRDAGRAPKTWRSPAGCCRWRATRREKTMIATDADALLWVGTGRTDLVDLMIANAITSAARRPRRWPGGAHARSTPAPTAPSRTWSWSCWVRCTISRPGRAPRSPAATSCVAGMLPGQPAAGEGTPVAATGRSGTVRSSGRRAGGSAS